MLLDMGHWAREPFYLCQRIKFDKNMSITLNTIKI